MDDFKREIWMQVRADIAAGRANYICTELCIWLRANGLLEYGASDKDALAATQEFFPEFWKLKDTRFWRPDGSSSTWESCEINPPWFSFGWPEPRLALIDYILTSTT
jgi:hypothetical protein